MYARKAHRNFYHFFKPLHICLPALLHLFLSYWCCQNWLTHFSQEHLEICCYTQRIILIGYHIFMCINFLLTCLLRGMTAPVWRSRYTCLGVSTHMPLARHDSNRFKAFTTLEGFYSHASCEAWRLEHFTNRDALSFYSHASCEAWRQDLLRSLYFFRVSTHMPLARHDLVASNKRSVWSSFYSHASCEAWLNRLLESSDLDGFYSHASCEAWHNCICNYARLDLVSTHMPLARHDKILTYQEAADWGFYSHASCEAWPHNGVYPATKYGFYSHASCEAWQKRLLLHMRQECFYSHASCEAWHYGPVPEGMYVVSTHMPLARHDW